MPTHERCESLINISKRDLRSAKILSKDANPEVENSCYHCQQSAEKALKAYLIHNNVLYKFTHNLDILCTDCFNIDDTFISIRTHCNILNSYSSETRYLDNCPLTEKDMNEAIELAEEVLNFVKEKIEKSNLS